TVDEGDTVVIAVKGNDTDAEDGTPAGVVTIVGGPANGTVTVNANGTVSYVHNGSETSSDSFTYTVTDSNGQVSNTATVNIIVNPVNDAPVASYSFDYNENSASGTVLGQVAAADPEAGTVTYSITGGNTDGWYAINANTGEITLTAAGAASAANDYENGLPAHSITVTVTVTATDASNNATNINVTLNERDVNDNAPVFEDPANPGTPVSSYT
ncbi:Ig-like domain-containing protein, partial [Acinetobacter guillouiae]|uniref:Ig-like domain-containing protein n=1 Tax=Acinetobacter guillouiae TaxID=106649 RepID=UPI003AF7A5E8